MPGFVSFKRGTHEILMHTLEDFYGATVRLVLNQILTFRERYNVSIEANPQRIFYKVEGHADVQSCNTCLLSVKPSLSLPAGPCVSNDNV